MTTKAEAPTIRESARSDTSGEIEVRTVSLTGDDNADQTSVEDEITAIHDQFSAEFDPAGVDNASMPGSMFGFIGPEALAAMPEAIPAAAECRAGWVGQQRRANLTWRQKAIHVDVEAQVRYERVSCNKWLIGDVFVRRLDPYEYRIWLHDVEYTKAWCSGNVYAHRATDPLCMKLEQNRWN